MAFMLESGCMLECGAERSLATGRWDRGLEIRARSMAGVVLGNVTRSRVVAQTQHLVSLSWTAGSCHPMKPCLRVWGCNAGLTT